MDELVIGTTHLFQMRRLHTYAVQTDMMDVIARLDRSDKQFVGHTMSWTSRETSVRNSAWTAASNAPLPVPTATCLPDKREKLVFVRSESTFKPSLYLLANLRLVQRFPNRIACLLRVRDP